MNGDGTATTWFDTSAPHLGPASDPDAPALTGRDVAALAGAGLVGSITLPGNRPGLGLAVTWTAIAISVLAVRRAPTLAGGWRRAMVVTAVLAAGLPAYSDAGWVVLPALLVGVAAAVLAFAGGGSWLGLVRPALRSLPLALRSIAAVAAPLRDLVPADARRHPGVRATLLTVLVVGVFGALFASADRIFGNLVQRFLVPEIDLDLLPARLLVASVLTVGAATLVRLRARGRDDRPLPLPTRRLDGIEWRVPLWSLLGLFAAFVTLQFGVLFGGHERVLQTAGLTYAEYARGGFGQLLVVAALTLAVVAGTRRYAIAPSPQDQRLQRRLLAGLCLLTLIVLVSAWYRLSIYQDAYGFTRLRFAAQFAIAWLAVVFVVLLVAGARRRTGQLPRLIALVSAVAVVGVAFVQPDAHIARWNVARFAAEGRIDVDYLANLSADAVPALLALPADVRGCVLRPLATARAGDQTPTWAEWNWSRTRAGHLLDVHGPLPTCAGADRWG
ncbi:MAG TPA: DUF4173 domain-containing protein [Egicoccus sp.]|nr:DUF4173 domain-containing protein [Egicoccus sp.]HSK23202.1 DUF4173 domain-containing protein [Egicoccus sp.]